VSFHAFLHLSPTYELMGSGSALGFGNGPLVISKKDYYLRHLDQLTVAIPGEYTTANLLLKIFAPKIQHKKIMVFNEIEDAILNGEADAGVIIHESRFTYKRKGLQLVADLGKMYEDFTHCPIPLGGIIALKKLGDVTLNKLNQVMHRSVEYAMNHPAEVMDFVRSNAQELDDEVIKKHIRLYVNSYTLDLGPAGRLAIEKLFDLARRRGVINP
jgi:1,4-dihydroxy-6-naphthoate synthase